MVDAARESTSSLPTTALNATLFIAALLPALFFKGPQIELFALAQIFLMLWLWRTLLKAYPAGLQVPVTPMALLIALFWVYLGVSLLWSRAPGVSTMNFWWMGSFALVFWLYTLDEERARLWPRAAVVVLLIALALVLVSFYQVYVLELQARSIFETRNTHAAFLNLAAFPAAAYFLLLLRAPVSRQALGLAVMLYALFLSVFLTAGRGAMLSLALAVVVLVALSARHVPWRAVAALVALLAAAFLSSQVSHGELAERAATLVEDPGRLTIWRAAWEMLGDAPWLGIGLGLFYLAYPPYRPAADGSAGFFAHNDYLQLWIEAGLPGLLLLLGVLAAVLWTFVRAWRSADLSPAARLEMAGLFCGLLTVATHSLVDFNLYILPIMMVAGLALGRLHELAVGAHPSRVFTFKPARFLGARAFPVLVTLLMLFPLSYFFALGLANSYYDKALWLARQGKLEEASRSLALAHRLAPADERMLITHADLFRHVLARLPATAAADRQAVYDDALRFLDEAQALNPLRGLPRLIRAQILRENPALAGPDWFEKSLAACRQALALDPLMYRARTVAAELLLDRGRLAEALQLLDEGATYSYAETPELIAFYRLTARLRREAGRMEEAAALEEKAMALEARFAPGYPAPRLVP